MSRLADGAVEKPHDRFHGGHQFGLLAGREFPQHRPDLTRRARIERGERRPTRSGQREDAPAAVIGRRRSRQQALSLEAGQDPAQVARIEPELPSERGGCQVSTMGELPKDPPLRQGELAGQQSLLQNADAPRVEPRESPHDRYPAIHRAIGPGQTSSLHLMANDGRNIRLYRSIPRR
ncbi:MAG: hypothetical protein ABI369_10360 [Acetobacteraceae bacterium]